MVFIPKNNLIVVLAEKLSIGRDHIEEDIIPVLGPLYELARFFLLEDSYTEREWKDMVSLHYINTSYRPRGSVLRVHFLFNETLNESSYFGFVTFRPISESRVSLSFIYPNFSAILRQLEHTFSKSLYVMTYDKKVHIKDKEIRINTFPFFHQDGMVTRCAHADILMVTKFLNKVWGTKEITIQDMFNDYEFLRTKSIPAEGLLIYHISEIFYNNKILIDIKPCEKNKSEDFRDLVDSYIESNIPIILKIQEDHVITMIGHSLSGERKKDYIVYDDSGAFIEKISPTNPPPSRAFFNIVGWDKFEKELKLTEEKKESYLIAPELDRTFVPYEDLRENYQDHVFPNIKKQHIILDSGSPRFLVVDSSKLKCFLVKNIKDFLYGKNEFELFINQNLPHFLWYGEIKLFVTSENGEKQPELLAICADATKHRRTRYSMFFDFAAYLKEPLGLLSHA